MGWKRAFFNMQKFELPGNKRIEPHSYCEEKGMRENNYEKFKQKVEKEGLQENPLDHFLTFGEGFDKFDTKWKGEISIPDFEKVYNRIEKEFDEKPGKWFTVVSNNCAHHMSYLLAKYAFRNVKTNTKKIVINFDAHDDTQGATKTAKCSNWAKMGLVDGIFNQYLHIGVKIESDQILRIETSLIPRLYIVDSKEKNMKYNDLYGYQSADKGTKKKLDSFTDIIQFVNEIKLQGDAAYYITVDLDFMKESYTAYGDGSYTKEKGHKMLESIFTKINKTNLYGVDVTGLPISIDSFASKNITESALEDVRKVYGLAQSQA